MKSMFTTVNAQREVADGTAPARTSTRAPAPGGTQAEENARACTGRNPGRRQAQTPFVATTRGSLIPRLIRSAKTYSPLWCPWAHGG